MASHGIIISITLQDFTPLVPGRSSRRTCLATVKGFRTVHTDLCELTLPFTLSKLRWIERKTIYRAADRLNRLAGYGEAASFSEVKNLSTNAPRGKLSASLPFQELVEKFIF